MDDQQNQSMQPGAPAPAMDPMAAPAMPATPPMPTPDMAGSMATPAPTDPMNQPAMPQASGMDSLAGMTPPPPPPAPAMDPMAAPAMPGAQASVAGPATLEDIMAELRKIEDKLVEMDEKL